MKDIYKTPIKAGISFLIGICGLIYINNADFPKSTYNPNVKIFSTYTLTDADRDGDVDSIKPKDKKPFVAREMVPYLKNIGGETFIDYMGYLPRPIPSELQDLANGTLNGTQDPKLLESKLKEMN
jgi:hypothetical protein